jgi:hypothetical protein
MNVTAKHRVLTALDVERHKHGVLTDARCPGLRLVATPESDGGGVLKSWIYRYRRHDRTRGQVKLGQYPRMTLAEARDAWSEAKRIRDDPNRGDPRAWRRAIAAEAQAKRARTYTVRDLLEDYFRLHAVQLAKGAEQERMLRHDVLPLWGRRSAADVTARDLVDLAANSMRSARSARGGDASMHDLVIDTALLIDGTGAPARRGGLGFKDRHIAAIGDEVGGGRQRVDPPRLVLAPGIVELHTHFDAQLIWDPFASPSVALGVTTMAIGNCALTIVPCRAPVRDLTLRHLTHVEGMPREWSERVP